MDPQKLDQTVNSQSSPSDSVPQSDPPVNTFQPSPPETPPTPTFSPSEPPKEEPNPPLPESPTDPVQSPPNPQPDQSGILQDYPPTPKDQDIQPAEELPSGDNPKTPPDQTEAVQPTPDPALQPTNSQTIPKLEDSTPISSMTPIVNEETNAQINPVPEEIVKPPQDVLPTQPNLSQDSPLNTQPIETTQPTAVPTPPPLPSSPPLPTTPPPVWNEPEPIPTSVSPPQKESPLPTSRPDQPMVKAKGHGVRNFLLALLVILFLGGSAGGGFWAYKTYLTPQTSTPPTQTPIEPQQSQNEAPNRDESGFVLGESIQNFSLYTDIQKAFSVEIPQDWKILSTQKTDFAADFTSPNEKFHLIVKNPISVDNSQLLDSQASDLKANLAAETQNPQISEVERVLVNGLAANRFEAVEKGDNQVFRAVYLLIFKDNKIFTLKAFGPNDSFSSENQTIERMLASFK
jgi:hypothetical protein